MFYWSFGFLIAAIGVGIFGFAFGPGALASLALTAFWMLLVAFGVSFMMALVSRRRLR